MITALLRWILISSRRMTGEGVKDDNFSLVIPAPEPESSGATTICISILNLDIKKVPTLMTKLNQEKKLSIGTRNIDGFNWGRFPPSEKRGKFDAPMKNPDTPNILF